MIGTSTYSGFQSLQLSIFLLVLFLTFSFSVFCPFDIFPFCLFPPYHLSQRKLQSILIFFIKTIFSSISIGNLKWQTRKSHFLTSHMTNNVPTFNIFFNFIFSQINSAFSLLRSFKHINSNVRRKPISTV